MFSFSVVWYYMNSVKSKAAEDQLVQLVTNISARQRKVRSEITASHLHPYMCLQTKIYIMSDEYDQSLCHHLFKIHSYNNTSIQHTWTTSNKPCVRYPWHLKKRMHLVKMQDNYIESHKMQNNFIKYYD